MMALATRNAATQVGQNAYGADYATLDIGIKSAPSENLQSTRRYRIKTTQTYLNESIDADRNYWNPVNRPIQQGAGLITPPVQGPFAFLRVNPNSEDPGQSDEAGSIQTPFWEFPVPVAPATGTPEFPDEPINTQIELSNEDENGDPNAYGNDAYDDGAVQKSLVYLPGPSVRFPGEMEPADTTIPNFNIEWKVEVGDEIRFINSEAQSFTVRAVVPPSQRVNHTNKLLLLLDRSIDASINKDFFLLRRWIYEPSSVVLDVQFPYADLVSKKEFIYSVNSTSSNTPIGDPGTSADGSITTQEQSGSFVTVYSPLLKTDNTPSGFLFPTFPVPEIELAPDEIMRQLRDNKLIE
jgi:hypothetical protein